MKTQNITGLSTERKVRNSLRSIGLESEKPKRGIGVDLEVWHSSKPERSFNVQIKGRGKIQTNKKYRWFQIGATQQQKDDLNTDGLPVSEVWRKEVNLCDYFLFVSEKYNECWVFPKDVVCEIIEINRGEYWNIKNNEDGRKAELNLDIEHNGLLLTEIYAEYLNNFQVIKGALLRK